MNELKNAASLYLLQHKDNPVHWKAWGPEPFEKAKIENKPVLVSVGYATCHWCHVMERESFEVEQVARYMNEHFVCIKVDREEHPEVDHMLMDALIAMTNQGGWPLNIFLTPDMKPFYGGTYFPPQRMYHRWSWLEVLASIVHLWDTQEKEVSLQADQLMQHLQQANMGSRINKTEVDFDPLKAYSVLMQTADREHGGWGQAPKFPSVLCLEFLLDYNMLSQSPEPLDHIRLTLDKMIAGGIYDQVEGGWFRYATDHAWMIPHFEKMLYDNAQMIYLLARVIRVIPADHYRKAMSRSLQYFLTNWRSEQKLFYSALDADSEGEEGRFYTWTLDELDHHVRHPWRDIVYRYYHISAQGNWEGKNIFHAEQSPRDFCEINGIDFGAFEDARTGILNILQAVRSDRVFPELDKKCQLSWNALFHLALCEVYISTNDELYLQLAVEHMEQILVVFKTNEGWRHVDYARPFITANADDWSYLIRALLRLASVSLESRWIHRAKEILAWGMEKYFDPRDEMFFFSSREKHIPVRKLEILDNILPSVNAVMSENLMILGVIENNHEWIELSDKINHKIYHTAGRYPQSIPYTLKNLLNTDQFRTVGLSGSESKGAALRILSRNLPQYYVYAAFPKIKTVPAEENCSTGTDLLTIITCARDRCFEEDNDVDTWLEKYC
ncbi:MAG: thioredoxin domain-containing protein [Taibaiella sp.]|nr:thioredoxin domain-containing protein [Taibaiella sp.]